jgi:hypothetical protein
MKILCDMIDSWISPLLRARKEPAARVQLALFVFVVAFTLLKHPHRRIPQPTLQMLNVQIIDIDVWM